MHQKIKEIFLEELKNVTESYRGTIEKEIVDRVEGAIISALSPVDIALDCSTDLRGRFLDRLEEIETGLAVRFLDNAKLPYEYDRNAISLAFDWRASPEGDMYWLDKHKKLQASILAKPL